MVRALRESGVTIILTTHYIEEAEEMADRIGVISKGELIVVEEKTALMRKLGKKQLTLTLAATAGRHSRRRSPGLPLELAEGRQRARSTASTPRRTTPASRRCCASSASAGIEFKDLHTAESSLEEIFVSLVRSRHER